jgi:hypothetical protein
LFWVNTFKVHQPASTGKIYPPPDVAFLVCRARECTGSVSNGKSPSTTSPTRLRLFFAPRWHPLLQANPAHSRARQSKNQTKNPWRPSRLRGEKFPEMQVLSHHRIPIFTQQFSKCFPNCSLNIALCA